MDRFPQSSRGADTAPASTPLFHGRSVLAEGMIFHCWQHYDTTNEKFPGWDQKASAVRAGIMKVLLLFIDGFF